MIRRQLAAYLTVALLFFPNAAIAGTTGSLKGTVSSGGAPLAGVSVTAVSPSQAASATTDASGSFVFLSLVPDTYTVTFTKNGYDTVSEPGQTIFADQSSTLGVAMEKALKTIATTRTRSAASLVRSGTTSDVYSVNATGQAATHALGGSGSLDQAYSAIASVPGVSIPTGQQGWYQSVFIRGGDYDQVGYEFDGIPVLRQSDGAPITTLSVLGQQEVQVYTGGTPATSDSPGLAGYINQVIKTGTWPGYANASFGSGTPSFYHKASLEVGGATPDRRFSYYAGFAGANTAYRYGDQFNNVSNPLYFYPLTIPTTNSSFNILDGSCGDPTLLTPCPGPNYGAVFSQGAAWAQSTNADRESILNFHFAIPHGKNGLRDDLQFLYTTGSIFTSYNSSAFDIGAPQMNYLDANVNTGGGYYNGPVYAAFDPTQFASGIFPSASESASSLNSPIPTNQQDGGSNSYAIVKTQYQRNINSNSYLRAIGYSEYTNWFLNGPNSANQTFGATLADYEVVGHIYGGSLIYSNSLSSKHLLTASLSYQTQKLQTYNAGFDTTYGGTTGQFGSVIGDLTDGSHCYDLTTGNYASCYAISATSPTGGGVATLNGLSAPPTLGFTCPNAAIPACNNNAQFLVTENGQNAQVDNVTPKFTSFAVTDSFTPNERWTINLGARFDHFAYRLDDLASAYPARAFWFNAYNNEHCFQPGQDDQLGNVNPANGLLTCPSGFTARSTSGDGFYNSTGGNVSQNVFSPRLAATYLWDRNTVLRGSIGVYTRPAATSYHEYNTFQQDLPSFLAQFAALGYQSPNHDVRADTSTNADFSIEHQFRNTQLSMKVSPFYRTTSNQLQYLSISALGGVLAGINVGTLRSYGLEVALQYGNFDRDGLSGELSYTYTNTHTHYKALGNGLNLIDVMNRSIQQYNSYTSACAANENTPQCGNGIYQNGAASFNGVANPYYNSAPQPLMDSGGSYVPYDVIPSAFASANSYAVPDVATLVLNWKHRKLTVTPSFSYNSGSYYGSPLSVPGYVPQNCTQSPALTPTTPGVSCGVAVAPNPSAIFVPDPYTGKFDSLGALREPSQLVGNLQLTYDFSSRVKLTLVGNNLYNQCFQRGYAWDSATTCWYSSLPSNILPPNGPGTQPGAFLTTPPIQLAYPYGVWFNNTQVGITSARQPVQVTLDLSVRL